MPRKHQHRQGPDHETDEIRAAVAQENQATRVVPDQEAANGAQHPDRRDEDEPIIQVIRHIGKPRQNHPRHHGREPVVTINDVDGIRRAGNRENRHKERDGADPEQPVNAGNIQAGDAGTQQKIGEGTADQSEKQAIAGADSFRNVFGQTTEKDRHAARDQQQQGKQHLAIAKPRDRARCQHREHERDPADPWDGAIVELLDALEIRVAGEVHVQPAIPHQQQRKHQRNQKRA